MKVDIYNTDKKYNIIELGEMEMEQQIDIIQQ